MISSTQVVRQNTPALEQRITAALQAGCVAAAQAYGEQLDAKYVALIDAKCEGFESRIAALEAQKPEEPEIFSWVDRFSIFLFGKTVSRRHGSYSSIPTSSL